MIDVRLVDSDGTPTPSSTPESSDAEEEDDDADSGEGMTEIRYIPDDKSKLEDMFTVNMRYIWSPIMFSKSIDNVRPRATYCLPRTLTNPKPFNLL